MKKFAFNISSIAKIAAAAVAIFVIIFAVVKILGSSYSPKPIGYFRIELKDKTYTKYEDQKYPFTFDYPSNVATVKPKKERADDKYGLNIIYPGLRGCIYCDYKPVNGNFREISEDCRSFVYKHASKADAITDQVFDNDENNVHGLVYRLQGNTASQIQFVLTDSTKHVFRGALYFNVEPNADSIAPVVKYVNEDIVRMIETFRWKD